MCKKTPLNSKRDYIHNNAFIITHIIAKTKASIEKNTADPQIKISIVSLSNILYKADSIYKYHFQKILIYA